LNISLEEGVRNDLGNSFYGSTGIITSPSHIRKNSLGILDPPNPNLSGNDPMGDTSHPRLMSQSVDSKAIQAPRLYGRMIYTPSQGSSYARMAKSKGAIPLNRRTKAMLNNLMKKNKPMEERIYPDTYDDLIRAGVNLHSKSPAQLQREEFMRGYNPAALNLSEAVPTNKIKTPVGMDLLSKLKSLYKSKIFRRAG
jgi:hypothetical protein